MDDFNDVQQKAQELTANVTNGSPAQTITPPSNKDESFDYAGYGEREQEKTKTEGSSTVLEGRDDSKFAVPYSAGGSYPGSNLYGADIHPDDTIVGLKNKFTPVEPYDLQIGNMSGKVDTLNLKKAFAELAYLHTPRGIDMGFWYGYDREIEEPKENFFVSAGRSALNMPWQILGTGAGYAGALPATIKTAYGELTDNEALIQAGNDLLETMRDSTNDFLSQTTFSYGEMGDNSGENRWGVALGNLAISVPISVATGGFGGAATFAAMEGLSNAYQARYAAFDRGVSGLGGLGISLGAGLGTAALGVSTKFIEKPLKGLYRPAVGWARALKENPKEFARQSLKRNFVLGSYDTVISEPGQDLLTAYLGEGRLTPEDWEQAWITAVMGTVVGAATAAVKTHADKKTQQFYNDRVRDMYVQHKAFFDKLIKDSNGGITQEMVDTWFEFLASGNTREGFISYLKNKMAENIDRYDSMPDEFKKRIEAIIAKGDGVTPLANEMAVFDARLDNMLEGVTDLHDSTKDMIREIMRGVALYDYMYRGTSPSTAGLPTIVADVEATGNPYTDANGVIHLNKASYHDYETYSNTAKRSGNFPNKETATSFFVKADAVDIANESENATFENAKGRRKAAHELYHWIEQQTGLMEFPTFAQHMTNWVNNVLPGIMNKTNNQGKLKGTISVDSQGNAAAPEKQGLARSEAYAYTLEYAKSLKEFLGLSGDMRKYMELFNAVSAANQASRHFSEYNKILQQEIKRNSATLDDLLSSYGEDRLRQVIKEYARTGDTSVFKPEDVKRLFEVMESLVDAETIEKMNTAFGDRATAQSFIDRYEQEYEHSEAESQKSIQDLKKKKEMIRAERAKRSAAIDEMGLDLQKTLERSLLALPAPSEAETEAGAVTVDDTVAQIDEKIAELESKMDDDKQKYSKKDAESVKIAADEYHVNDDTGLLVDAEDLARANALVDLKEDILKNGLSDEALSRVEELLNDENETTEAETGTETETEVEVEAEDENAPFRQYGGQAVELVRDREKAQWFERWLSGEKVTPEQYDALLKEADNDILAAVGFVPKVVGGRYILRQNQSPNKIKISGIMTAEWQPTDEQIDRIIREGGVNPDAMTTEEKTAIGHKLALMNVKKVYSIQDDISAFTGLESQALEDLVVESQTASQEVKDFADIVQDTVKMLDDLSGSLNHSGVTLSVEDINRELPLLETAVSLASEQYDDNVPGVEAIRKFQNQIDVKALNERIDFLERQRNLDKSEAKRQSVGLPNDPFRIVYQPTGKWYQTIDKKTGKVTYKESKRPVGMNPINQAIEYNQTDLLYWMKRIGAEVDKFPSVEALESYIRQRGMEPISFNVDYVKIDEDSPAIQVPNFLTKSILNPQDISPLYARNEPVSVDFNSDAVLDLKGALPTHSKIMIKLLKQANVQKPANKGNLSLEEKLIYLAAIGRARMIANNIMDQLQTKTLGFAEWATVGPEGNVIKGADLDFVTSDRGKKNVGLYNQDEVAAGKTPYLLADDLDVKDLPIGLKFLATFESNWKRAFITEKGKTRTGRDYYVVRFAQNKDGTKVSEMVWDYGEFELLQNNNAFFAKPDSEFMTDEDIKYSLLEANEFNGRRYTEIVKESREDAKRIAMLPGEYVYDNDLYSDMDLTDNLYSINDTDYDYITDDSDIFAGLSNEQFENVNPESPFITGEEASNEELYKKMKLAEENGKKSVKRYLVDPKLGYKGGAIEAINSMTNIIKSRKLHPMLFAFTRPSGLPHQFEYIFGEEFARKLGLQTTADDAERTAEKLKNDVEKALLANTFKNTKELNKWQIRNSVDMDGVKAELDTGAKEAISKDEILSLYIADLTKDGKHPLFKIPAVNGGIIEENGFTHVYNKLHSKYKNFNELVGLLTEQDKAAAEIGMQHLFRLRATGTSEGDYFVPVNTYEDYTNSGGWANRRHHNVSVFGTRLLNPSANLVATGMFATINNMASTAGVRVHNYIDTLQTISDMFNIAALADEKVRVDRGFYKDLNPDNMEEADLVKAIAASNELNAALSQAVGANGAAAMLNDLQKSINNQDNGAERGPMLRVWQQLTRSASAMALSFKPRQALTNFFGNYIIFGGLSGHGALRHNTVDLINAIAHGKEAKKDMENNKYFMHRLEQAALSEQYKRALDSKSTDTLLGNAAKIALEHGKTKTGDTFAALDATAKYMTKHAVGWTNTIPDVAGIALGRWVIKDAVYANVRAQLEAEAAAKRTGKVNEEEVERIAEEQIADYMFSHISSSNVMARGQWAKGLSRVGLEGLAAFKNDALQKSASFVNAWTRYNNSTDKNVRKQALREMESIVMSTMSYVAIQAGLVFAAIRTLSGDDLNDKEREYLVQSLLRELIAQIADVFNGGAISQPILENLVFGKSGGADFLPTSDINRVIRNIRKGDIYTAGGTVAGLAGFSPMERAVQLTRATIMAFGDDERAAAVGRLMIAGRGESTAMNMLGYTKNKKGKIVRKKSKKKKD
jgi:hypothetical protein